MRTRGGSVQDRGTSWRISYYDAEGVRQFEGGFASEDDARRELAQRIADVAKGIPVSSKPNTVTFGELAVDVYNDYEINKRKSIDDIEARFRLHIVPVFGKRKAVQITSSQLNAYIVRRKNEGASVGTINRELEAVRHTFKMALEHGRILRMPKVPHLKENNIRTGFFSREEVERLCAAMKEPYASFTLFGFLTGWRYSEIQGLQWRNVDFRAGEIRLDPGTTKSGEGRVMPMCPELRGLLSKALARADAAKRILVVAPTVPIKSVPTDTQNVFSVSGRPVGQFRKTWKAACRKAGLPVVLSKDGKRVLKAVRTFHDLRRSAAREFQRQGFTEGQIMKMCGWATRSVFDRYAIVTVDDIREKMERVAHGRASVAVDKNQ